MTNLARNLRVLCSYGRSTSDICRRLGLNRQQFDRYINGQTQPSLSTLRRICDFFGVDEAEILMDPRAFIGLVRLRPPRLGPQPNSFDRQIARLMDRNPASGALLERHEGFYHVHFCPDPARRYILRTLCRIFRADGAWLSKSIERHGPEELALPSWLRYNGIVIEAHGRIIVQEREQGLGRSFWTTILIGSDYAPTFLPGLVLGIAPDGGHDVNATRTLWQYLGRQPDVRAALRGCGLIDPDDAELAEYVRNLRLADQQPNGLGLVY